MTEYRYERQSFDRSTETVEIPDNAVGITTDYFGDLGTVDYLLPVEDVDEDRTPRECPKCGQDGHQAWVLGHWHCPHCDLTYTDAGDTDVTQI